MIRLLRFIFKFKLYIHWHELMIMKLLYGVALILDNAFDIFTQENFHFPYENLQRRTFANLNQNRKHRVNLNIFPKRDILRDWSCFFFPSSSMIKNCSFSFAIAFNSTKLWFCFFTYLFCCVDIRSFLECYNMDKTFILYILMQFNAV